MAITLKSPREIALMCDAGAVVAEVLSKLKEMAVASVTTARLNEMAMEITEAMGAEALFKGVHSPHPKVPDFPGAICASVNEQIVHGIPSKAVMLREGDILSIDFGVKLNGYCADAAVTVGVGMVGEQKRRLMDVTRAVLEIAIRESAPGVKWSSVASKMQAYVKAAGFSVVEDYVGHGIGRQMHEEPRVPNFVSDELLTDDIVLAEGMVLAVEPMVNAGDCATKVLADGWTVVTKDGKSSAHFEHTIAIIKNGCKVLTAAKSTDARAES